MLWKTSCLKFLKVNLSIVIFRINWWFGVLVHRNVLAPLNCYCDDAFLRGCSIFLTSLFIEHTLTLILTNTLIHIPTHTHAYICTVTLTNTLIHMYSHTHKHSPTHTASLFLLHSYQIHVWLNPFISLEQNWSSGTLSVIFIRTCNWSVFGQCWIGTEEGGDNYSLNSIFPREVWMLKFEKW